MADQKKQKGGCLRSLLLLVTLTAAVVFGLAMAVMLMPQDLSDIKGYQRNPDDAKPRDLQAVLRNAVDRKYQVVLSEREINAWLEDTIRMEQRGLLGDQVKMSRVWVRLKEDMAEVVMERTVFGRRLTMSMFIKIRQEEGKNGLRTEVVMNGGKYHKWVPFIDRGGRFGQLVVPQGYLYLVMPAYEGLAEVCREEIRLGFEEMAGIRIEEDRLILNPSGAVTEEAAASSK